MRFCAVVPTHNHHRVLPAVVDALRARDLPVLVIDDGSEQETAAAVAALHAPDAGVTVHRLPENRGKGEAVMAGLSLAEAAGYTHAVQVDADGQHDLERLGPLMDAARAYPSAIVTGRPVYDDSMPTGRKVGRWITHVWVWVETLSLTVRDSMCGFRVYPVADSLAVWRQEGCGRKMDFDTEIMVRLVWRGARYVDVPTRVVYPEGNTSNFRLWADNVLISWMHTRLVFGMLARLPGFLRRGGRWRRPAGPATKNAHWSEINERGLYWGIRLLGWVYALAGRTACQLAMSPVIAYFFLTGREARAASMDVLGRVARLRGTRPPSAWDSFRHFYAFGGAALDKVAAWCGEITIKSLDLPGGADSLFTHLPKDKAVILFVSHFGNIELVRALATRHRDFRVNVLLHQKNAARFGRLLRTLAPESQVDLIEVTDVGPDTAIRLSEKVARGEWIVIAADRVAIGARDAVVEVPFLGAPAPFPQGPHVLAHLMGCPVYMAAAWRVGKRFRVSWAKLADRVVLPRKGRAEAIAGYAATYATWLEGLVLAEPRQWFNFYPFWTGRETEHHAR